MTFLLTFLRVAPLAVLIAAVPALVLLGVDTFRETARWTPPAVDIPPAWRVVQRAPYDYESEVSD